MGPRPNTPGLESTDLPGELAPVPPERGPGEPGPGTVARAAGEAPHVITADSFAFLSPPDRPDDLGRLGPYHVVKLLGEGGMGFVFLAEDEALHRSVALKVMRPEVAADPTARERFLREGRAAAAIKSDHVITIYQVSEANGVPFLAMEYLEGQTLEDWLKAWQQRQQGPVPAKVVIRVAKDMLRGLVAAHEKGLVHRDIKPANLWIEAATNRLKILDFGLTRGGGAVTELTRTGQVLGTVTYMAPEQARGKKVDARADLFSAGVVLHRMLGGQSPFKRDSYEATIIALAMDEAPSASSFSMLPPELSELIDRMLSKDPNGRPASASAALAVVQGMEQRLRNAAEAKERAEAERIWKENERLRQAQADSDRAERMELWKRSGMPRAWVQKHLDGWGPDDWTALVSGLMASPYWPLKAEEMGTYLEGLRGELRAEALRKQRAQGEREYRERKREEARLVHEFLQPQRQREEEERKRQEEEARRKAEEESREAERKRLEEERERQEEAARERAEMERQDEVARNALEETRRKAEQETARKDPLHRARPRKAGETITFPLGKIKAGGILGFGAKDLDVEMTFAWCPPSRFQREGHRVTLTKGFYTAIHPVTQAQWKAITGTTPSHFKGENRPVEQVSWDDCQEFCKKLTAHLKGRVTVRLPSEAEWEYACRASTTTEYNTGDGEAALQRAGWYRGNSGSETHPVGELAANAWGLYDMHGNVWEWCQDWYGPYSAGDQSDPGQLIKQAKESRVLRGGGWNSYPASCRAAFRYGGVPGGRSLGLGCRVCFRLD